MKVGRRKSHDPEVVVFKVVSQTLDQPNLLHFQPRRHHVMSTRKSSPVKRLPLPHQNFVDFPKFPENSETSQDMRNTIIIANIAFFSLNYGVKISKNEVGRLSGEPFNRFPDAT
jgi:hypothetical protein